MSHEREFFIIDPMCPLIKKLDKNYLNVLKIKDRMKNDIFRCVAMISGDYTLYQGPKIIPIERDTLFYPFKSKKENDPYVYYKTPGFSFFVVKIDKTRDFSECQTGCVDVDEIVSDSLDLSPIETLPPLNFFPDRDKINSKSKT